MRHRRHDPIFKESAVQQALAGDREISEVARDLDVNYKTLYQWVRAHEKRMGGEQVHVKESLEEENKRLKRENERLRMEREILKKATAFFVKESK